MIPDGPLSLRPLSQPIDLKWCPPGSKSLTNRALALAALAEGTSTLTGVLESDDTRHMATALRALGISITQVNATTLVVEGGVNRLSAPEQPLFVGNSGTTVRFLTAMASLVPGAVTLVGDKHMAKRPIVDLVGALEQANVTVDCPTGCPPLTVHGTGELKGEVALRGDRSSQYFSALILAAAGSGQGLTITIEGSLVSRPYVDMTNALVASFGGEVRAPNPSQFVVESSTLKATTAAIEPDASAASYALATATAVGGRIHIPDLGASSLQGDVAFAKILEQTGSHLTLDENAMTLSGKGTSGIDVDMHHISDTVMTLAAIAPLLDGPTTIRNIANIRIKETDRLSATVTELRKLGQEVSHGDDWIRIDPQAITPATVHCYADHRMAMSFAILGLAVEGVTIEDPACVTKTYPGFWDDLAKTYTAAGDPVPWLD